MENTYSASGTKLRYLNQDGEERLYLGSFELLDGNTDLIKHTEGYLRPDEEEYHAEYLLRDHLGNTVVSFWDKDGDGKILSESQSENDAEIEVLDRYLYYPFGLSSEGQYHNQSTSLPETKYKYNGKEKDDFTGFYDFHARTLDVSVGRFLQCDPKSEQYAGWAPQNYTLGNPLRFTDPTGMNVETTIVGENDDGTYTVKDWVDDGSTDIVTESGKKIGNSLTTHSFVDDQGDAVKGAIIDPSDNSGQEFFDNDINRGQMWMWSYMPNATGDKEYDFKRDGAKPGDANYNNPRYHYRGMSFEGRIASARDIGNFAAGAVAGSNGLDWNTARLGFDGLQKWQDKSIFSVEGVPTQSAQRAGHNLTYPQFIKNEYNMMKENPMHKVIPKW